jgi:hypothetical protein
MVRPCVYNRAQLDDAILAVLSEAAARGERAPSLIEIGRTVHCRKDTAGAAIRRLAEAGRIDIRGSKGAPSYLIVGTGQQTTVFRPGRPPTTATVKRSGNLTPGQRETLSIARQLARDGREICAAVIAPRVGLTRQTTLSRLVRLAGNGYLRPTRPGHFALVDTEQRKREEPQPIVDTVVIDGREIRRTRYPAMMADGALHFGCGFGHGAAMGDGSFRNMGRAA